MNKEDRELLRIAKARMKKTDLSKALTMEQVIEKFGITEEELDNARKTVEIDMDDDK